MDLLLVILGIRIEENDRGISQVFGVQFEAFQLVTGAYLFFIKGEEHGVQFYTILAFDEKSSSVKIFA